MDMIGNLLASRCGACGETPALGDRMRRCGACNAAVCAACWRDRPLLSLISTGCQHRQILPGQRLGPFPGFPGLPGR